MLVVPRQSWRDAVDARHDMIDWFASDLGMRWMGAKFRAEGREYRPSTRQLQAHLFGAVPLHLMGAKPIFVSRDMCRLVEAAAETFAPEPVYPTDVLSLDGWIWFERAFVIPDRFDEPVTIRAISWGPMMADDHLNPSDLLSGEDAVLELLEERHRQGRADGLCLCLYADPKPEDWEDFPVPMPVVEPMHITPWWWGMSFEGNEITESGRPSGAAWWWKIVQTCFRLMQQRITVRHRERPARAQRRQAQRMGLLDQDVTVIRLRRETAKPTEEPVGSSRNYTHRWIVEGFWRDQWYPSVQKHRQIWIADYEKGPAGAPLLIKPRAYAWTR